VLELTSKQYLRQAYRLNERINSHIREVEQLKLISTSLPGIDFSQERVQGGNLPGNRIANIIAKITDLERQINREIDSFIDLKQEIHDVIEAVKHPDQKLVLRYRYIEFFTWEETAKKLNYSLKQIHRIHSAALQNVVVPKR
jgi:DNA-directed RNA polymerase specialized sigma subunit